MKPRVLNYCPICFNPIGGRYGVHTRCRPELPETAKATRAEIVTALTVPAGKSGLLIRQPVGSTWDELAS